MFRKLKKVKKITKFRKYLKSKNSQKINQKLQENQLKINSKNSDI